jgi:hypothetical protein
VQYLSDTPDAAWAEFLRHEEITDEADLAGIERSLWAVEIHADEERIAEPRLFRRLLIGGRETYEACRREALRLRRRGASAILAPAAALKPGRAGGQYVRGLDLIEAPPRDGHTLALFGPRPELRGWVCVQAGRPSPRVLELVNHF